MTREETVNELMDAVVGGPQELTIAGVRSAIHYLTSPVNPCATCRHSNDDGRDVWCGQGVSEQGRTSGLVSAGFGCNKHDAKETA